MKPFIVLIKKIMYNLNKIQFSILNEIDVRPTPFEKIMEIKKAFDNKSVNNIDEAESGPPQG